MDYEMTPLIKPYQGGKAYKNMSNKSTQPEVVKTPKAKYSKTRSEHYKDIAIFVLVTAIIAFVGGMSFQSNQQQAIETAVKGASTQTTKAPVKK